MDDDRLAFPGDLPASRVYTPERIFIRVDLPAPFSPTRACTSPLRTSRWTLCSARTPGKLLPMPSSLSRTSPAPCPEERIVSAKIPSQYRTARTAVLCGCSGDTVRYFSTTLSVAASPVLSIAKLIAMSSQDWWFLNAITGRGTCYIQAEHDTRACRPAPNQRRRAALDRSC